MPSSELKDWDTCRGKVWGWLEESGWTLWMKITRPGVLVTNWREREESTQNPGWMQFSSQLDQIGFCFVVQEFSGEAEWGGGGRWKLKVLICLRAEVISAQLTSFPSAHNSNDWKFSRGVEEEFQGLNLEPASGYCSRNAVHVPEVTPVLWCLLTWGRVKETRLFSGIFHGSHSEYTGSASRYGERAPY